MGPVANCRIILVVPYNYPVQRRAEGTGFNVLARYERDDIDNTRIVPHRCNKHATIVSSTMPITIIYYSRGNQEEIGRRFIWKTCHAQKELGGQLSRPKNNNVAM